LEGNWVETVIRQASIDDKKAIWDFIKVAYGDSAQDKIPDRWNWEFLENPLVDKSLKELPIFIAIKDGKIAGQVCAILSQIKIGEEMHRIAWGADVIVLPICRGEGVGQKLIKAIAEYYELFMIISAGVVSRRILDRLGYNKIEPIPTYRRFVKLDRESVFRFIMKKTENHLWFRQIGTIGCRVWFDKIISVVANFLLWLRDLLESQTKKGYQSEIREVPKFGDEIDQLWRAANHKFKVIVRRDQQYLNWRFSKNSHLNYRKFISTRDGETRGYVVLRIPESTEMNVGIIVDLFADPDDNATIEDLIRHAIDFLGNSVLAIECPTTQREYQKALSKLGFFKIEKTTPVFFCMNSRLKTKLEEWGNSWFLTKADQDWDQLRPI
jgi:GNAT superfamily N-acetyltransferase